MPRSLSLLYRGRLASCNYACGYCPFAKRRDTRETLARDASDVHRFVDWVDSYRQAEVSVLFTPWGEALVRRHYRDAMVRLSHMPHVRRVVAQTNLSFGMRWLDAADLDTLALWCTWHPSEIPQHEFLARCDALHRRGVRFSVGMVAMHGHREAIAQLRAALPPSVYLWLNAYDQRTDGDYDADDVARLSRVDPWFGANLAPAPSLGAGCRTGDTVVSVDGDGGVRRCHFVAAPLGNLYDGSFERHLAPRPCPNAACDCFIGYVHRTDLDVADAFVGGALERIPHGWL